MANRKANINKNKQTSSTPERDFDSEYRQLIEQLGYDYESIEADWYKKSNHIKKFSLLRNTPPPIVTFNTISYQYIYK